MFCALYLSAVVLINFQSLYSLFKCEKINKKC